MAISFHCSYCGKKIEAADSAGGKWGRCPACHKKIYVPLQDDDEELKLAPMDESEEEKRKQLMAETYQLRENILQEREIPNGPVGAAEPINVLNEKELTKNIILHLQLMADGNLDEAQRLLALIAPYGERAVEILDRIALSEIPEPELAEIPQQVLAGLIRTLRSQIS